MSNQLTVVVTGVGSTIGLGVAKALRLAEREDPKLKIRIIGVDSNTLAVGLYCLDSSHLLPLGSTDFESYYESLIKVCKSERADILLSGWDGELIKLGNLRNEFYEHTKTVVGHKVDGIFESSDKWTTGLILKNSGINVPFTVDPTDSSKVDEIFESYPPPYIMKPRKGSGSRGLFKVTSKEQVKLLLQFIDAPILQEQLLPDEEEYTIGVFSYGEGEDAGGLVLKRTLMSGLSYRMEVVDNPELLSVAVKSVHALGLIGAANVQLRVTSDGPKVFEINPRFSSSSSVRAFFGFNEPLLAINYFLHHQKVSLSQLNLRQGVCLRYWEEMFLDADCQEKLTKGRIEVGKHYGLVCSGWS